MYGVRFRSNLIMFSCIIQYQKWVFVAKNVRKNHMCFAVVNRNSQDQTAVAANTKAANINRIWSVSLCIYIYFVSVPFCGIILALVLPLIRLSEKQKKNSCSSSWN